MGVGRFLRRVAPAPQVIAHHGILPGEHAELIIPGSALKQQSVSQGEWVPSTCKVVIQTPCHSRVQHRFDMPVVSCLSSFFSL